MTKQVTLYLLLITLLLVMANVLTIHHNRIENHLKESQSHLILKQISHKFSQCLHYHEDQVVFTGPAGDFFAWLQSDEAILTDMQNGQKLSDESADKIKNYMAQHPQLIDNCMISKKADDPFTKCVMMLNKEQKGRFYGWVLDTIDFKDMFVKDADIPQISDQNLQEIGKKAIDDPQIGPIFSKCKNY